MSGARRTIAIFLLKALVTVVCLWWLARYFDFVQVRNSLANISPLLVLFAIVLHLLSYLAGGVRWWLLFRHLAGDITFRHVWQSYYLALRHRNALLRERANAGQFAIWERLMQEATEKFQRYRPDSLGQASRLEGITPGDVAVLSVHLKRHKATA